MISDSGCGDFKSLTTRETLYHIVIETTNPKHRRMGWLPINRLYYIDDSGNGATAIETLITTIRILNAVFIIAQIVCIINKFIAFRFQKVATQIRSMHLRWRLSESRYCQYEDPFIAMGRTCVIVAFGIYIRAKV